jgi:hypothetical protein
MSIPPNTAAFAGQAHPDAGYAHPENLADPAQYLDYSTISDWSMTDFSDEGDKKLDFVRIAF